MNPTRREFPGHRTGGRRNDSPAEFHEGRGDRYYRVPGLRPIVYLQHFHCQRRKVLGREPDATL